MNLLLLTAALALGQPQADTLTLSLKLPKEPKPKTSIDARKEARDQLIESIGREALPFTKAYGDRGIAALQQCSPATGKKLVALHNTHAMTQMKNPLAVIEVVRRHGEPIGLWLVEHHERLRDDAAMEVFIRNPEDVVYDLVDLEAEAASLRASRKIVPPWIENHMPASLNANHLIIGVLGFLLLVVLFCKRRGSQQQN